MIEWVNNDLLIILRPYAEQTSVSVSVETRRSDDLYTGASPDGDGVETERWPLLGGDGGRKEMGRGRLEVLVDNAWRTHVGRRGGEGCYDTYRSVLYRDPRASRVCGRRLVCSGGVS